MPERFQSVNSIESAQKLGFSGIGAAKPVPDAAGRWSQLSVHEPQGEISSRAVDVIADGDRRPRGALLPGRGERRRPGVAAVKAPGLVGALELAVAETAHRDILADADHDEIGDPVAVDVGRIGAGDAVELGAALGNRLEGDRAAHGAGVAPELRRRPSRPAAACRQSRRRCSRTPRRRRRPCRTTRRHRRW